MEIYKYDPNFEFSYVFRELLTAFFEGVHVNLASFALTQGKLDSTRFTNVNEEF